MKKTIRMPKELLEKWLAALRSGEYKQGTGRLADDAGGYCCLGVLQAVAEGDVERYEAGFAHHFPSFNWLQAHSVEFADQLNQLGQSWTPYLPALDTVASNANDDGKAFAKIADAIEACAEGI